MKPLLRAALAFFLAGCAADTPPAQEVRDQFERGLSGGGHIVPLEDPAAPNSNPSTGSPGR